MKLEGSVQHSQGLSNSPYLSWTNPIARIDTYFFKIHSNIILSSPKGLLPVGLTVKILKGLPTFLHSACTKNQRLYI